MMHITVNGQEITLSDIRPVYCQTRNKVGIEYRADKELTGYERECIGRDFVRRTREGEGE